MEPEIPWESVISIFRALGDPSRFKVLMLVLEAPRNVTEIVHALGMKQSLVSHHLGVLRECGLLKAQRKGPFVLYQVSKVEEMRDLLEVAYSIVSKGGQS